MRLYDEIINDILTDLSGQDVVKLPVGDAADPISRDWQDAGKAMMILQADMAYELGGHNLPAVGNTLVTTETDLVGEDEIILIGKDLPQITEDTHMQGSPWYVLPRIVLERETSYTIPSRTSATSVTTSTLRDLCFAFHLPMTGRACAWRQMHWKRG